MVSEVTVKDEFTKALNKVKHLREDFEFTVYMLR